MVKYNFVELSGLESLAKDAICGAYGSSSPCTWCRQIFSDVIGIVKDQGELASITSKVNNKVVSPAVITAAYSFDIVPDPEA
jgi:replication factor A1